LQPSVIVLPGGFHSEPSDNRKSGQHHAPAHLRSGRRSGREHTAPFGAMRHILEALPKIAASGKPYSLKAGDVIFMARQKPYIFHNRDRLCCW
jgi:hypothetical protein